jgi:hypothetical protein
MQKKLLNVASSSSNRTANNYKHVRTPKIPVDIYNDIIILLKSISEMFANRYSRVDYNGSIVFVKWFTKNSSYLLPSDSTVHTIKGSCITIKNQLISPNRFD